MHILQNNAHFSKDDEVELFISYILPDLPFVVLYTCDYSIRLYQRNL